MVMGIGKGLLDSLVAELFLNHHNFLSDLLLSDMVGLSQCLHKDIRMPACHY